MRYVMIGGEGPSARGSSTLPTITRSGSTAANAFIRDGDGVFRTYFINNRGDEAMGSTWSYLDLTALGRQEQWEDSPGGYPQTPPYQWWKWHDADGHARATGPAA
jgi:predicted dithiol-disulfide oxidoreductase (DUF899 family)